MKPIVLLDLDGPIADFDARFFRRCADEGWPMDCAPAGQRHRFATDHVIDKEHQRLARAMVNTPGWFADLPVVDGALDGLRELAGVADCWLASKPLEANPTCRDDKAAWVARELGDEWVRRLIITPDKSMVCGSVLLDDAPYLDWLPVASWRAVIFPMPWNGPDSKWGHLPRWGWGDPVGDLLDVATAVVR